MIKSMLFRQLALFLRDHGALLDAVSLGQISPDQVSGFLAHASTRAKLCDAGSPAEQLEVVSVLVRRVSIASTQMTIEINGEVFAVHILDREGRSVPEVNLPAMQIQVPIELRRRGVEAKLIVPGPASNSAGRTLRACSASPFYRPT